MTDTNPTSSESTDTASPQATRAKKEKIPAEIWLMASWCKGCGICVDYCKPGAIKMDGVYPASPDTALCTRCRMCEAMCPDFSIEIDPLETKDIRKKGRQL